MNGQETITLSQFFSLAGETFTQKVAEVESERQSDLTRNLENNAGIKWAGLLDEAAQKLPALLDVPIYNIIARAWGQSAELSKFSNPQDASAIDPILLPIHKHTLKSEHHPHLDIFINGQKSGEIGFDVNISFLLEGLILKINEAKIKEIHVGKCAGSGEISYKGVVIARKKSPEIHLPGVCCLGDGVASKKADSAPARLNA
jgi:hypothetical protein